MTEDPKEAKLPKVDVFIYKVKPKLVLIALLDGPCHNAELARRVNMSQQGMSRLLVLAEALDLIESRKVGGIKTNRLTDYGRGIAEDLKSAQEKAALPA